MAQEIADSTLLDTWASSGAKIEPDISKIIEGWQLGEQPPHEYMNWLQNTLGSKLNHILKNGVASWNNETEYLAGSSVQHNGSIWICKTTNTNSEPTDVSANWKRIITVEALTTVLAGYVATTGNQTIAGVKTFSSSPIVPTPTTGTQVANKDYVDNAATLNINALTAKPTPDDTDNLALQEAGGGLKKVSFQNLTKLSPNDSRAKTALNASGEAPIYACRAWVNFNGTGTVAIGASGNISSITDNGVGDYTVNFTTAILDTNYCFLGYARDPDSDGTGLVVSSASNQSKTTSQFGITTFYNAKLDSPEINLSIFR